MVYGEEENFKDVRTMIDEWNNMEHNEMEWLPVEGVRRGGRKMSRRISDLMRSFQEGGGGDDNGTDRVDDRGLDSLKPTFNQNSEKVIPVRKKIKIIARNVTSKPIGQGVCAVVSCDWSSNEHFATNQKKRKTTSDELIGDGDSLTKKRRPGQ